MRKFWNWARDPDNERTLYLNGPIAEETWWGDEVTPQMFKDELLSGSGDITVWINSPGGDVFAAAQIYNMLMEYTGNITVKIDGIAASAASVIAMAGGEVHMSPVSMLMIHNPATVAIGDSVEMVRAKELLDEVKESIINAYELKTGMSRVKLAHLMDAETWMNAHKAMELGFADGILYTQNAESQVADFAEALIFSRMAVTSSQITALASFPPDGEKLARSVSAPLPTKPDDFAGAPIIPDKFPKAKDGGPVAPPAGATAAPTAKPEQSPVTEASGDTGPGSADSEGAGKPGPDPAEDERDTPVPVPAPDNQTEQPQGTPVESLYKRLSLISH